MAAEQTYPTPQDDFKKCKKIIDAIYEAVSDLEQRADAAEIDFRPSLRHIADAYSSVTSAQTEMRKIFEQRKAK